MDQRMFDFADFYYLAAEGIPDGAVIAEVGVADGASSIFLAETLLNMKKEFKLYLIDSMDYGGADQFQTLLRNIQKADLLNYVEVLPHDSLNASCRFPDNHFDFIFIDASHRYEFTKADIRLWHYKVKHEGLLAGHDYNDKEGAEVKMAVNEVIPIYNLHLQHTAAGFGVWYCRSKLYAKLT